MKTITLAALISLTAVLAAGVPAAAQTPAAAVKLDIKDATGKAFSGNPSSGKTQWAKCTSCHSIEAGKNGTGPSLNGIIGRKAGTIAGFKYTDANKASAKVWTQQALFDYLEKPRQVIPGTSMQFVGIKSAQQRADLIAWLVQNAAAKPK